MSVMPTRPPGRRTRAISAKTAGLSAARLTTQLLMTTSIEFGGQRDGLDVALEELDIGRAGLGDVALGEGEHLVGHVEAEGATGRRRRAWPTAARRSHRPSPGRGRARPRAGRRRRSDCRSRARPGRPRRAARRARARSTVLRRCRRDVQHACVGSLSTASADWAYRSRTGSWIAPSLISRAPSGAAGCYIDECQYRSLLI